MSGELLAAIIGGTFVGVLNLIGFAFTYGKLTQSAKDHHTDYCNFKSKPHLCPNERRVDG